LTPERWAQIEEVFHRAAECDPSGRAALLNKACGGDAELRRAVEELLASEKQAADHVHAMVHGALEGFSFPLVGQTVSHYHILNGLGGGGMGLVYRAKDIRLNRQVALKFLPEHSAKHPAALGRFEREARSASALEHPNICPIYEFGEHEGRSFIVMQLLEGQTLRELLSANPAGKPPFTCDRLLGLAIQIADGLATAHKKGIIHCDIKPANIFVTREEQAKILDFGLAKLVPNLVVAEMSAEKDLSESGQKPPRSEASPFESSQAFLSRTGVATGTAGYMSPEQARGEKLDARTDVFSFGVVLYEMATGRRAITSASILAQIPATASDLNPRLPARLPKIINKALDTDKEARYPSAVEIRTELQNLKREAERHSRWRELAAGAAALLLVSTTLLWYLEHHRSLWQASPRLVLQQLTFNSSENPVTSAGISPDGRYVAYSDLNGMYVKSIETGTIQAVPWPEGLTSQKAQWEIVLPAWFPDGQRFIANIHPAFQKSELWNSETTTVWMVSARGGVPRKLRDKSMAWAVSPDGSLVAYGRNKRGVRGDSEIWLMTPNGMDKRKAVGSNGDYGIGVFQWIPNSSRFSYTRFAESGDTVFTADLNGGPSTLLLSPSETKEMNSAIWLPDGRLLYPLRERDGYQTCNFWTRRIDPRTGAVIGKPYRMTNWLGSCLDFMSVTADGKRLAFMKITEQMTSYLADVNATGRYLSNNRHFSESESSEGIADWTPDSRELIVQSNRASDYFGMYRQPLNEESAIPLDTKGFGRSPSVTPDSKWILYLGYGNAERGWWEAKPQPLLRISISGGAPTTLFTTRPETYSITCARPPATICAINERSEDARDWIISLLDPLTGRGPELARLPIGSEGGYWWAQLSADGTRIVLAGDLTAPIRILSLRDHAIRDLKVQGWTSWYKPTWAADGKGFYVSVAAQDRQAILYLDLRGNGNVVWEAPKGAQETLARPSPDGRYLAIQTFSENGNLWLMENF
jgi:serine/threonine protein kinase